MVASIFASQAGSPYGFKNNGLSASIARVKAKAGRARWCFEGDSLYEGAGAFAGGGSPVNPPSARRSLSMPQQLAALLAPALRIPTRCDAWVGSGNISSYPGLATDAASVFAGAGGASVSFGAGWASAANPYVYGGQMFTSPTNTTPMTYTPGVSANRFDIWYHNAGSGGTFTVSDASGVLATITVVATATLAKATVARAAASTQPISIAWASGGAIIGPAWIEPYNTLAPALEIINMGGSGLAASNWVGTGNNRVPTVGLPQAAFDVNIIGLGVNDMIQGRTVPQFQTDLGTLAGAVRATSEVILTKASKPSGTGTNIATYLPAIDAVATAQTALAVIDFYNGLNLVASDYFATNEIHLSEQGYGKEAAYALSAILAVA